MHSSETEQERESKREQQKVKENQKVRKVREGENKRAQESKRESSTDSQLKVTAPAGTEFKSSNKEQIATVGAPCADVASLWLALLCLRAFASALTLAESI